MCMTTAALVLFLSFLSADRVTEQPGRIIIHATEADVHWIAVGDNWCTGESLKDGRGTI